MNRLDAQYYAIGAHEIVYRIALLQKLRVAAHVKRKLRLRGDGLGDPRRAADRYRRFGDHHRFAAHVSAYERRCLENVLQIRGSVLTRRRSHSQKHDLGKGYRFREVGREREPALLLIALDQRLETRLVDGHLALLQPPDLPNI